uniref:Pleurin-like n=1 Tax=Tritonia tetraquetra TaxID=2780533 RepID=I1SKH8_9GAST|nr:pleurin-like precursor [Tritonia tetraquetra]
MYQILQLFTLCLFAGTTYAVFYIPGSVVSCPKMGKRAFYTNATGNRYPLMGRRSGPADKRDTEPQEPAVGAMVEESNEYNKRGVFTQGPHRSFPRVGRAGVSESPLNTVSGRIRSEFLKSLAERLNRNVLEGGDGSDVRNLLEGQGEKPVEDNSYNSPAQLSQFLFLIFDQDGDSQLSKSEFYAGVGKIVEQNLLC